MNKLKIDIIGRGNVACHLNIALNNIFDVNIVNPRTIDNFREDTDICLISVRDNAIEEVANKLSFYRGIIAHTSGSTTINIFSNKFENYGVFYPLQTFSKDVSLDYSTIHIFIEASNNHSNELLKYVASKISPYIHEADSELRKQLHVASVFACNYVNHLFYIADKLLQENSLDINVLIPLIEETTRKIKSISPENAQTGPARRNDSKIINSHLELLSNKPEIYQIYKLMADSIIKTYQD